MADPVERGAKVRFPPPLVFVAAIALGLVLHRFVRRWPFHMPRALAVLFGVAGVAAALWLGFPALRRFRLTGQDPVPWKPTPSLIFDGPYRWTRNPMYVGMLVATIGVGLLANTLWVALLAFGALGIVHFTAVRREEEYLRGKFGAPYEEYLRRVRRYF